MLLISFAVALNAYQSSGTQARGMQIMFHQPKRRQRVQKERYNRNVVRCTYVKHLADPHLFDKEALQLSFCHYNASTLYRRLIKPFKLPFSSKEVRKSVDCWQSKFFRVETFTFICYCVWQTFQDFLNDLWGKRENDELLKLVQVSSGNLKGSQRLRIM